MYFYFSKSRRLMRWAVRTRRNETTNRLAAFVLKRQIDRQVLRTAIWIGHNTGAATRRMEKRLRMPLPFPFDYQPTAENIFSSLGVSATIGYDQVRALLDQDVPKPST